MSAIGKLFGGSPTPPTVIAPSPVASAPPPTLASAAMASRDQNRALAGMSGTILTGALGVDDKKTKTTRRKTLLGE